MNLWDIIILLAVSGAVVLAVRSLRRGKKAGCCGTCSCCASGCACREKSR
jgi:hypothetical protein